MYTAEVKTYSLMCKQECTATITAPDVESLYVVIFTIDADIYINDVLVKSREGRLYPTRDSVARACERA